MLKVFFAENGTQDDLLASIGAIREDAIAALEHFQLVTEPYERGDGQHPQRFAISALAARLLAEHHATTVRWALWAEQVVSSWDSASTDNVAWGVKALRATGEAFPLDEDPVRRVVKEQEVGLNR